MAADLEFRISAELTEIKGALASLRKDFADTGKAAQQAGGSKPFAGLEAGAGGAIGALTRLAAGFATVATAIKLIGAADELNTLNARLKIATSSTEEYNRAQVALFDLAQRTRTGLGETVSLYSQIANATKDAGVGQETLLQVVETINQATQLSGASAQAAEAALTQLGQGLASGTLRGEELNSILEQTPALADAIAKGMGITRGELRKYGEDGKITAEQVIKALQAQRDEVAKQFATLPVTVGQSVTLLKNAGLQLVGAFDEATGGTSTLAEGIKSVADFLSSDEVLGAVTEFAAAWREGISAIVEDAKEAYRIIREALGEQAISVVGDFVSFIGRAFRELPVNVRAAVRILTVEVLSKFDTLVAGAEFLRDALVAVFTDDTIDAAAARYRTRVEAIKGAAEQTIGEALADRDKAVADAAAARKEAERRRQDARNLRTGTGTGNFKTTPSDKEIAAAKALAKARLDAEEKVTKDGVTRIGAVLQESYDDNLLAADAYFAARERLELNAIDRQIAIERERAKAGGPDAVKANADIQILEAQKADVIRKGGRDRVKAAEAVQKELADIERQGGDRIGGILADYYADNLISAEAYFEARKQLELNAIDQQIAAERARIAAGKDADGTATARLAGLEAARVEIGRKADRDLANSKRDTNRQLDDLRAQDLENQQRTAEAAGIRLEAQFRDLRAKLVADGNQAGVDLIDKLIDTGKAKARFDQLRTQFDKVIADLQARQQQLADLQATGGLSTATAAEQQAQARAQALEQLKALNAQLVELAQRTNDPAIVDGANRSTDALRRLGIDGATGVEAAIISLRSSLAQMDAQFAQSATNAGVDALTNFFTDIASGTKSAGEALRDFVRNFVQSMAQIAARALATYLVLQLLDAVYPGLGKVVASSGAVGATVKHSGGIVGEGGAVRQVNPLLFAGAPRFHSGGMVGLKPGEVPAILQTGEEVLSRTDPRNAKNGGGQGAGQNIRIINTVDPALMSEYLASPAGEKIINNHISRNAATLRNVLA